MYCKHCGKQITHYSSEESGRYRHDRDIPGSYWCRDHKTDKEYNKGTFAERCEFSDYLKEVELSVK